MSSYISDIDINAKIPIIRIDTVEQNNKSFINTNSNHPKASFRLIPQGSCGKRTFTALNQERDRESRECYFHYQEPTEKELDERVEYDMDLEDIKWLQEFNKTLGAQHNFPLSETEFEKVMDRLEKESYFESCKSGRDHRQDVDDDAVCAICGDGDCQNSNVIIFCDMCDLAVHQECYGVPYVPLGQWLCKRCQFSPAQNVECCLCPNLGGAFKQTETRPDSNINNNINNHSNNHNNSHNNNDKRKNSKHKVKKGWAHVVCALWIPEVAFANTVFLEPIEGIENIGDDRWKLKCYICNQRYKGACIQCFKSNCYQSFHVTCGKQAGLYMKIRSHQYEKDGEPLNDVIRQAFCDKHTPAGTNPRGSGMYSGDDTDEDVDSEHYRKKAVGRKRNIKKTRETLAKQVKEHQKDAAMVKVDDEKLSSISRFISIRRKNYNRHAELNEIRLMYTKRIHNYWHLKRTARNGVPLLRRLQVSLHPRSDMKIDRDKDRDKFTSLRYDLEKVRILMGEIKKRERFKMRSIMASMEIVRLKLRIFEKDHPATED